MQNFGFICSIVGYAMWEESSSRVGCSLSMCMIYMRLWTEIIKEFYWKRTMAISMYNSNNFSNLIENWNAYAEEKDQKAFDAGSLCVSYISTMFSMRWDKLEW